MHLSIQYSLTDLKGRENNKTIISVSQANYLFNKFSF